MLCSPSACGERGQQRPQALHSLRAMRRHAIVPDVFKPGVAVSARGKASSISGDAAQCRRASRAVAGIVAGKRPSEAALCLSAGGGCERGSRQCVRKGADCASRPHSCFERCRALPSCRMRWRMVQPSVASACEEGQQRQQALPLLRAMRGGAVVSVESACFAEVSECEEGQRRRQATC